ncbi:DNA repair protein RecN [bioreactor metagenome]|uniref:DNA repair protein RecN n=1 Tax=bioreactor metagenome TaxID=1076179 RepID=A0A644XWV8_9ZZZZ
MLRSLSVRNFALIEKANVDFIAGLNVLTGETGAGKSILIDALNTVLGGRASNEYIREGCDYFRVEALFDISCLETVKELAEKYGIGTEDDGTLIISRRFSVNGKNVIMLNGCHVTLSVLKLFGQKLVDMHGQHENQALLRPDTHLGLLDLFDKDITVEVDRYRKLYRQWLDVNKQIINSENNARERVQRLDMLIWQTNEIAAAALKPDEEGELENQIKVLTNMEKITKSVTKAYGLLDDGSSGADGILSLIANVKRELDYAVRFDKSLEPQLNVLTDILYQLKELSMDLSGYVDGVEYNPNRLTQLQERADVIYKLRNKYGATIGDILTYYEKSLNEIASMNAFDDQIAKLHNEQKTRKDQLMVIADKIDKKRRKAANMMSDAVCSHLQKLGMPNCRFSFEVSTTDYLNAFGNNEVSIVFSANPGESSKPLHKVASGGELSRIALAIKTVCAHRDTIGTVVFDEIDSGIGGQTAQMVGERIALVALHKQVLCITHSPQIACMADNHLNIEKRVQIDRTKTEIIKLNDDERKLELARMIAGSDLTKAAIENAEQMINAAKLKKEIWKKETQARA